jgi:hypothetical protein
LNATIEYLESKNRRLSNKVIKYKGLYKKYKISKKTKYVVDLVSDDDDDCEEPIVMTIEEKPLPITIKKEVFKVVEEVVVQEEPTQEAEAEEEVVEAEAEAEAEAEEAEEAEEEEVVEEAEEVVEEAEEVVEEEEEEEEAEAEAEEVVEEAEKVVEEAEKVVEEEAEEVVEEEEAEEVVEEEAEEEEAEEEEEEEAEVYEVVIKGKTYYVQNEKDGPIYEADENGDISLEVGVYKNGKPVFF